MRRCGKCKYAAMGVNGTFCFVNLPVTSKPKPQYSKEIYHIPITSVTSQACASFEDCTLAGIGYKPCVGCMHLQEDPVGRYFCALIFPPLNLAFRTISCAHFMEKEKGE